MKLEAKAVFTVTIRHSFFLQGFCPELEIEPTQQTKKILIGRQMLFRKGSVFGIYTLNEKAVLIKERFVFYIKLKDPAFSSYTDIALEKTDEVLYFTGTVETLKIDGKNYTPLSSRVVKVSGPAYSHSFLPGKKRISLLQSDGKEEKTVEFGKDAQVDQHVFYPLLNEALYTIQTTSEAGNTKKEIFTDFNRKGDTAIVGLIVVEAKDLKGALSKNFIISFRQKNSFWQYIVGFKKQGGDVRIDDKGFTFEKREKISFTPINLSADEKKTYATLLSIPEISLYAFVSTAGIPSSEKPKSGLMLIKDGVEVRQLPNPLQEGLIYTKEGKNISMIYVTI